MAAVYEDILYSGCLGMVNLGISILVYNSTKAEQKQKLASEHELSTRLACKHVISLPSSFTFLSTITGMFNFGGAFFGSWHIHLLEIPTAWLTKYAANGNGAGDAGDVLLLEKLIEAEWVVAVNDWGSLFLVVAFFLSGCFNFATVRQLRTRDREAKRSLLPVVDEPCLKGGKMEFEGVVCDLEVVVDEKDLLERGGTEGVENNLRGS